MYGISLYLQKIEDNGTVRNGKVITNESTKWTTIVIQAYGWVYIQSNAEGIWNHSCFVTMPTWM